jgi:F0F1-type ATP synthase epsilon subunit
LYQLGQELEAALAATQEMPRALVELIYSATCCVPTPEAAQKQPCSCVAAGIVEKSEDWASALATKAAERDAIARKLAAVRENLAKYELRDSNADEILMQVRQCLALLDQ